MTIMINDLDSVLEASPSILNWRYSTNEFHFYCPRCMGDRKVIANTSNGRPPRLPVAVMGEVSDIKPPESQNFLIDIACLQCNYQAVILGIMREDRMLAWNLMYLEGGSFATPHAPESVAFYMDQGQKAYSMGANSAAVAMFRAALEHVLYKLGFQNGMLGAKISALEQSIIDGTASPAASRLEPDVLRILNRLGNASIHSNDGTLKPQAAFSSALVAAFQQALMATFDVLYEEPERRKARLAQLATSLAAAEGKA